MTTLSQAFTVPSPFDLEVSEGFHNPIGFYDSTPNFSWKLPQGVSEQNAYEIAVASDPDLLPNRADIWNSGKIESDQSVYVPYEGPEISSRDKLFWKLRFWNEKDESSAWSESSFFEMGLLKNSDWHAKWIGFPEHGKTEQTPYQTPLYRVVYLRKDFGADADITKARLYISAKGLFEAHINGKRVGKDQMTPGWTPYQKRVETLTYDVTGLLQQGDNAIGLILAEGWHSGRFGPKRTWGNEPPPQIICQLEIECEDGTQKRVITDDSWIATINGPIRTSGIYDGERYNAHYEMPGWDQPGFAATDWTKVIETPVDPAVQLRPKRHFTTRNMQTLVPTSISKPKPGFVVFDMGQNMVGVPLLCVPMKKGQTLRIRVAEALNRDGMLYTDNLGSAKSIDTYTASKDGLMRWQPKFTFHGFRYIELSGYDVEEAPQFEWAKGIVQYTNFEDIGLFESSSENLNQLQKNILWSLRGNFLDIPTDCPQRAERLGWTGDAQVFIPTALFNSDLHAFWSAWLQSMREEQYDNGMIPIVIPNATGNFTETGWSDACTIIPWETYRRTGDIQVLKDNFDMMLRWLDYSATHVTDGISSQRTVGDWLQPYSQQQDNRRGDTNNQLISTAYYARSIELTQRTAEILGDHKKSAKLSALYAQIKEAFQEKFFDENGRHIGGMEAQTSYLLALGFELLSPEIAEKAADHLIRMLAEAEGHLRTGFLGTPLLAPTLDKIGRSDLAFDLLFKETYPSWFFSISQGATTIWEQWNGFTHLHGVNKTQGSLNHYAYGAIGEWMYERVAGIYPLKAGYKKIRIAPLVGGPLTFAHGRHLSPFGLIESRWSINEGTFELSVTIPPNTTAVVELPEPFINDIFIDGNATEQGDGHTIQLDPGHYQLSAEQATSRSDKPRGSD